MLDQPDGVVILLLVDERSGVLDEAWQRAEARSRVVVDDSRGDDPCQRHEEGELTRRTRLHIAEYQ